MCDLNNGHQPHAEATQWVLALIGIVKPKFTKAMKYDAEF